MRMRGLVCLGGHMASVSLALLQRRARSKQSRLRKKGASKEAIADVSPVRPWSEVKAMTAGQKLSYRAQLKRFTSRENAYHVYKDSGAISTKATYRNTQEAIEQINRARQAELERIIKGAEYAASKGLVVNAGHGLNLDNVTPIAAIPQIHELNIGHSLIADAVFVGLAQAVQQMKAVIKSAR